MSDEQFEKLMSLLKSMQQQGAHNEQMNKQLWDHLEPTYTNVRNLIGLVQRLEQKVQHLESQLRNLK
jgi:hypothetical protein